MSKTQNRYIPVTNWEEHHSWPSTAGFRHLIFNRKTNGLDKFSVIKKVGKRVLVDEAAFFDWIANQSKGV